MPAGRLVGDLSSALPQGSLLHMVNPLGPGSRASSTDRGIVIRAFRKCAIGLAALALLSCDRPTPIAVSKLHVDSDYYTLPNGLKVVLSRDTTAPTVGVGVYYHVGFRS